MSLNKSSLLATTIISIAGFLSACSSSDSNSPTSNTQASTQVSGTVFASYVNGANVSASDRNGNTLAGPTLSNSMGEFTLNIPDQYLSEDLIITALGGTYKDEATGQQTNNTRLSALIEGGDLEASSEPQFSLTPSSSIIEQLVSEHRLSLTEARTRFNQAFGYAPDSSIIPVDASSAPGEADEAQILSGLRAATFSQLTSDLNIPADNQSALLALLANDLSDGSLDGKENGSSLQLDLAGNESIELGQNIQNRFNLAFSHFRNSGNDQTGLSNAQVGHPVFAKTAVTENYVVNYVPSMMGSVQGKTTLSLDITDREGNPATGLTPSLAPLMFMADRTHATPFTTVTESDTQAGLYHATIYYLMASSMANGQSMGFWQLTVSLEDENAVFYPHVAMSMANTARANLKSQTASIPGMMDMTEKRTYLIFNNGLSDGEAGKDFSVFIATKETMMHFPALALGLYHELEISSIDVEMSTTPESEESWVTAESKGNGVWTATGLSNFEQQIYVRLFINSEQSTDDGNAPDGVGDTAEFMFSLHEMDASDTMHSML